MATVSVIAARGALAEANPHVRTLLMPGADHHIHRTRYGEFMALVEPFLADGDA